MTGGDDAAKREAWHAELNRRGLENVKLKLLMGAGVGRGADVHGFENPPTIPRSVVEDWVADEEQKAARQRWWTLIWAIIGGVAGIGGIAVAFLK
jgi:hypothetical protein